MKEQHNLELGQLRSKVIGESEYLKTDDQTQERI